MVRRPPLRVALDLRMLRHTGIGASLRGLVPALAEADPDLELRLLLPSRLSPPPSWERLPARFQVVPWPDAPAVYSPRVQWAFRGALRGLDVDLLHVPHFDAPFVPPVPMTVTIHDLVFEHFPAELPNPFKRLVARAMLRLAARAARRVVTVSAFVAEDLQATLGLSPQQVVLAPHGLPDPETPLPAPAAVTRVRSLYGLHSPYVLSLGMQRPRKNLVRLVQAYAASRLPGEDVHLVLAGPRDPRGEDVGAAVRAAGLEDRVHQVGFVADEDLPGLYAGARAFAFPSLMEGFGFPALEAFRYGAPVAAARASSLPEVCQDAAVYFDPRSLDEMRAGLEEVCLDRARAKALAQRGLRLAAGRTWAPAAAAHLRAWREALG